MCICNVIDVSYCDGMTGDTVSLLYNLLLELDKCYSKPIKGLDEANRQMDHGVKTDIWSVMEDFSKAPGGQDFSKMKSQ
jgi:hypothetical protein